MDFEAKKELLKEHYLARNVVGIVRLVTEIKNSSSFPKLHRNLLARGLISGSTGSIEQVADALLAIVKNEIKKSGELDIQATYFEIGEQLKRKFGPGIADCYVQAKMPDDFMTDARQQKDHGDSNRLSEHLVEQYKKRLVDIEKSRREVVSIIQPYSTIPIHNLISFNNAFEELTNTLKTNYKYLTLKTYLEDIRKIAEEDFVAETEESELENPVEYQGALFRNYVITGTEPDLRTLVQFHIAVTKLFQVIKKKNLLEEAEYNRYWSTVVNLWHPAAAKELSPKARKIFNDLLDTLNQDRQLLRDRLAATFIEEYQCSEDQMKIRHRLIETELSNTKEYLKRIQAGQRELPQDKEEKVRIAVEKVACLNEIFENSIRQEQASEAKTDSELEQSALDISTVITPYQLTDWIKIYSIIYTNQGFLEYAEKKLDLSVMRDLISDLTSYHLIQNIAQLKFVIDSTPMQEEERKSQLESFREALKVRLHSLMDDVKQKERSLMSMINELSFLNNKAVQFLVADTFKGFQIIVDAFNSTASDYFVTDREMMLKESRAIYNQICNKCMRGFTSKPRKKLTSLKSDLKPKGKEKRSWLGKLFS